MTTILGTAALLLGGLTHVALDIGIVLYLRRNDVDIDWFRTHNAQYLYELLRRFRAERGSPADLPRSLLWGFRAARTAIVLGLLLLAAALVVAARAQGWKG